MPRNQKPDLYKLVKDAGLPVSKSYVLYTLDELKDLLTEAGIPIPDPLPSTPKPPKPPKVEEPPAYEDMPAFVEPEAVQAQPAQATVRRGAADPNEMAGQRLNTHSEGQPIRVDDQGRVWFQEEVKKPAYPKPRGRRVLTYIERGVEKETIQSGEYIETFEVAGKGPGRPAEVKITLPSYQVGIYGDPRFPFRIHCYNGMEGFDFYEVNDYYGGAELVPDICKRIYIENDLCYDIRSVIRAIQTEYRQLQLAGRVK